MRFHILIHTDLRNNFMCYFTEDFTWISHVNSQWMAIEFHMLLHENFTCKLSVNGERIFTATPHTFHLCFTWTFSVIAIQISCYLTKISPACWEYCKVAVLSSAHCMVFKYTSGCLFRGCKIWQATSLTEKSTCGLYTFFMTIHAHINLVIRLFKVSESVRATIQLQICINHFKISCADFTEWMNLRLCLVSVENLMEASLWRNWTKIPKSCSNFPEIYQKSKDKRVKTEKKH